MLKYFCENGHYKVFDRLEITEPLRRYYVPVREITMDGQRYYVPLNEARDELIRKLFPEGRLYVGAFGQAVREEITSDLTVNDYRPIYAMDKNQQVEILPIDVSIDKLDALYGVNRAEMLIVKYLPVFTLGTNLCEVLCVGSDEQFWVVNRAEVNAAINPGKDQPFLKKYWVTIEEYGGLILSLGFLSCIGYGVYKLFTVGFSSFGAFFWAVCKAVFYVLGAVFMAVWVALWLGLYVLGFALIFGPVLMFLYCIFYRKSPQKVPNEKKGRKVMNLI